MMKFKTIISIVLVFLITGCGSVAERAAERKAKRVAREYAEEQMRYNSGEEIYASVTTSSEYGIKHRLEMRLSKGNCPEYVSRMKKEQAARNGYLKLIEEFESQKTNLEMDGVTQEELSKISILKVRIASAETNLPNYAEYSAKIEMAQKCLKLIEGSKKNINVTK
ncbi:hypothetical protein D3C85_1349520 [compost metagenome]